jgi:hypothetical protein
MTKQLKTMPVDALLEEISVCDTEASLIKIKKVADKELDGQDNLTRYIVMQVYHYKKYLICKDDAALSKLLRKNWMVKNAGKIAFYDSALSLLQDFDIEFMLQLLNQQMPFDTATRDKISTIKKALEAFEAQCITHMFDGRDVRTKSAEGLLA